MTPLFSNPSTASYPFSLPGSESEDEELINLALQETDASGSTLIVKDAVEQINTNFGVDWSLYDKDPVLVIRYKKRAPRKRIPQIFCDSIYTTTEEQELKKCPPSPNGEHIFKEMVIREELIPKTPKFVAKIKPGKLDWLPAALSDEPITGENNDGRSKVEHLFGPETKSFSSDKTTIPFSKSTPASKDQLKSEWILWERIAETIVPLANKILACIKAALDKITRFLESKAK